MNYFALVTGFAILFLLGTVFLMRPYAVHVPLVRTAALVPDRRIEIVHLLALVPLAVTGLILALGWSHIPDTFSIHWSGTGRPTGLVFRSLPAVFAPIALGVGLVLFFWLLLRYATPGSGRLRWILPCIAWYIAVLNSVIALLPLRHDPATPPVELFYAAPVLILFICTVVIASHLRHQPGISADGDGTPDSGWVAGVFYYNPQDPALWVEKRFGIGWTLNFARPASWLMLGVLLIPVLAVAWFAHLAMHSR